ncbi:MAG TPA: asparagine synthetase B, partial [Firmicutes bacterium]|nr:asparagine synthetase B [Bacillota bacterium]
MCGICGIYGEANEPVVADMLDAIRHRGPDSFEVAVRGRHSLGAARLALISKHRGNQPNSLQPDIERSRGAERPCTVLLNGEIYNYRELQADLCDVLGSDASEVEVIGALYRRHGIEAIPMFRGMFALAILDGDRLVLARDRFGIKPLFFCRAGKAVLFASEIKALLRHPAVTPNLSLRALQETAVFGFICSPTLTPFEGVEQVSPGTILTVEPTRITRRTYYRVPPCRNEDETCTPYSQAVARLSAILQQSVESLMLHGEDRKGLYLSGGLDSSLVALLASRVGQQPLLTFTLYDSEGSPDLEVARRVAHAIGSQHFEFKVDLEDYLRELPDFVHHYENFIAGGVFDVHGGVAFHLLSRRVAE